MMIRLHKNATTTLAIRAAIQASDKPVTVLAREFGVSEDTIRRWKKRESVYDDSHTPHRLQTTLTPAQERAVVELRKTLLLALDDLLVVVREFIHPKVTRSALNRCLVRHGVGRLRDLKPASPKPSHSPFRSFEPGYLHIDVKYLPKMPDEEQHRYLFMAIDRATRWVFVQLRPRKTAAQARAFLQALHRACPVRIHKILTGNGKEFTDRKLGLKDHRATGAHEFDQLCAALGIENRLTRPRTPRTNGMVECFNGRIAEVLATHRFNSAHDLKTTLTRYAWLYNHHLLQKALGHITPMQAMKKWYAERPGLFVKKPRNQPEPHTLGRID
jgi:transposase InsO family protein